MMYPVIVRIHDINVISFITLKYIRLAILIVDFKDGLSLLNEIFLRVLVNMEGIK